METVQKTTTWRVAGGLVLILIGTLFLLGNVLGLEAMKFAPPLMVLAFGGIFFVGMVVGGKQTGALAIPGCMFVILGLMLTLQAVLDVAQSWAYAWALFAPGGVGVGLVVFSWWSDKPELKRPGYILISIALVIFVAFGMFFETLFSLSGSGLNGTVILALGLMGVGVLLLLGRLLRWNDLLDRLPPHSHVNHNES
jgi:hypothetical protein